MYKREYIRRVLTRKKPNKPERKKMTYIDRLERLGFINYFGRVFEKGDLKVRQDFVKGKLLWQFRDDGVLIYENENVSEIVMYLEEYYGD